MSPSGNALPGGASAALPVRAGLRMVPHRCVCMGGEEYGRGIALLKCRESGGRSRGASEGCEVLSGAVAGFYSERFRLALLPSVAGMLKRDGRRPLAAAAFPLVRRAAGSLNSAHKAAVRPLRHRGRVGNARPRESLCGPCTRSSARLGRRRGTRRPPAPAGTALRAALPLCRREAGGRGAPALSPARGRPRAAAAASAGAALPVWGRRRKDRVRRAAPQEAPPRCPRRPPARPGPASRLPHFPRQRPAGPRPARPAGSAKSRRKRQHGDLPARGAHQPARPPHPRR